MRAEVAVVGYGRTPYSRAKPGERLYNVDEYIAWAADLALEKAGMTKNDFDDQGLAVAHAEVRAHRQLVGRDRRKPRHQPARAVARRPGRCVGIGDCSSAPPR